MQDDIQRREAAGKMVKSGTSNVWCIIGSKTVVGTCGP